MLSTIQKWGNSQGLRLAKTVLQDARLKVGDQVDIRVDKGHIVIAPTTRVRGRYDLRELLSNMPERRRVEGFDQPTERKEAG
ncbi:MAG: AbrB/MazE/SpoVT family DNA-binding domain-containing protein [Halieaceae bacterium]|nr:AbrB/MazE/SpoVT family DNA-binding domain-containing protein [Halieaceae bacterium]